MGIQIYSQLLGSLVEAFLLNDLFSKCFCLGSHILSPLKVLITVILGLLFLEIFSLMQGNRALNTHVPAIIVSFSSVCAWVDLRLFIFKDCLITKSCLYLKQLLFDGDWMIESFVYSFMIGYVVGLNPFRPLPFEQILVSQVFHRFDCIADIRSKYSLSMIESMITGVIDLPGFDAANLFAFSVDTVVEGLAHDSFASTLQTLFGSLISTH